MNKIIARLVISIIVVIAISILFLTGFRHINDGYMGVEISVIGKERVLPKPLKAGWYWRRPFMIMIQNYSVTQLHTTANLEKALDKNKKWINISGQLDYQLQGERLVDLHQKYNSQYKIHQKMDMLFQSQLKASIAQFTREEIFGDSREKFINTVNSKIRSFVGEEGIETSDFIITDLSFPNQYTNDLNRYYPATSVPITMPKLQSYTSDKQSLYLTVNVYYHIALEDSEYVHTTLGTAYVKNNLEPAIKNAVDSSSTLFTLDEIYSGETRDKLVVAILNKLKEKMQGTKISIDDVIITSVQFDSEYQNILDRIQNSKRAVEQIEVQEKERELRAQQEDKMRARGRRNKTLDAEAEKDAEIIRAQGAKEAELVRAEGRAEALLKVQKIIAENPNILRYLYVDKISDKVKVIVMPADNKNLDIQGLMEDKEHGNK